MQTPREQKERFIEAFNTYSDALFRHALFRVSDRQVSIDLVQDAYTKTWAQVANGQVIENFQSYLYHVLNNLIIDYYRKKKSVSLDTLAEDGFDPAGDGAEEIVASAEHSELMHHLDALPQKDRDVIVMRYIDGLQIKQIAQVLGETENSVSVRVHRAIKKLQSQFHE